MTRAAPDAHPSVAAVRDWLVGRLAMALGAEPREIDGETAFAELGLSSQDLVVLSGELEEWLKRPVAPTLAWEFPTIDSLALHLARADGPASAVRE